MKFKVGDKVRLMKNSSATHGFKVGEICKIVDISNKGDYYPIKIANKKIFGFVNNKHIQKMSEQCYTYENLKKSPIGTRVTFKDGTVLVKNGSRQFESPSSVKWIDDLKNLESKLLGKIIKIEEPEYTTVYEYKPEILDEVEKRYLRGVIRPFKDSVEVIIRRYSQTKNKDYIQIRYKNDNPTNLPYFEKDTMYKGMKLDKRYTLDELGL